MVHFETIFLLILFVTLIFVGVVAAGRGKRDFEVVKSHKGENIDANQASIPFFTKLLTMEKLAACNVLLFQDRGKLTIF